MNDVLSKVAVLAALCLGAAFWTGCAGQATTVFRPMEQATAVERGQIAARYALPPEAPRGDVRVASMGVSKVRDEQGKKRPAVAVRLVVSNDDGAGAWSLTPNDVRLEHPVVGALAPSAVRVAPRSRSADGNDEKVTIARGEAREIDLHYHLPEGDNPGDVHRFDLVWTVQTDGRAVSERTPFERVEDVVARPTAGYMGYGPVGWYGYGRYYGPNPYYYYQPRPVTSTVRTPGPLVRPVSVPLPRIPASPRLARPRFR